MAGLGFAPIGTAPAGFVSVDPAPPQPRPGTGARLLAPSGGYVIDPATLDIAREPEARHRVRLALMTEAGTATADQTLGIVHPRKIDQSFQSSETNAVNAALARVELDGSASIDAVNVDTAQPKLGTWETSVAFTDSDTQTANKI